MSFPPVGPTFSKRDERWLCALFIVAWFVNFGFSLVGWENTLISRFEFRQSQTALSTAYFPPGKFPLAYETPVFGPPWSVPLEFPLFEAAVSNFSAITGLPLDPSGRLVSWIFFQLSLPAFFLLLGSLGVQRAGRLLCLSLLLTSPIYLFFSRAFLIESTVLCCCAWFLAGFARWVTTARPGWLVVAVMAGSLGATVKVTTMVVFGAAAVLFAFGTWWYARRERSSAVRLTGQGVILRSLAAFLVPMIAGLAWVWFSGALRGLNSNADLLKSHFGFWSFGDLAQRLSVTFWQKTVSNWTKGIVSEAGLVLAVFLFVRYRSPRRPIVAGTVLAFLSGQLIFSNLFMVHDYYFYANGVFLVFALGLLLLDQFEDQSLPRVGRIALPVFVMLMQVLNYARFYFPEQRHNEDPDEHMRILKEITHPEDTIIIFGFDWDATIPYYAERRALMFSNGREARPDEVKRSIDRLDPHTIGAVLIIGPLRHDAAFTDATMAKLQLGPAPLLLSDRESIGIWVPAWRTTEVRDRLPLRPYPTFDILPVRPVGGAVHEIGLREISQRREFVRFHPRPFQASSPGDFSLSLAGPDMVLNAHAPTELVFRAPAQPHALTATFGIHSGAYTAKDRTDGVEFVVVNRTPNREEKVLFSRFLNPAQVVKDQGTQQVELVLPPSITGEIILRTQPGPNGNFSFDWAYWGEISVR